MIRKCEVGKWYKLTQLVDEEEVVIKEYLRSSEEFLIFTDDYELAKESEDSYWDIEEATELEKALL